MKYFPAFLAAFLIALTAAPLHSETSRKTRLFILAGQSNMKHIDPEEAFTPAIKKAFPNDDIIVVHDAQSGQPIRRWYKNWKSAGGEPSAKGEPNGKRYKILMTAVDAALQGKPTPDTVAFCWMQGENDTLSADVATVYEASLKGLIAQLRDDLKRPDTFFVIGRISDFISEKYPEGKTTVREAQVAVATSDPLGGWIDTDDLNGKSNGVHYNKAGYKVLAERFAAKSVELINSKTKE
jgi:hypothetical protein